MSVRAGRDLYRLKASRSATSSENHARNSLRLGHDRGHPAVDSRHERVIRGVARDDRAALNRPLADPLLPRPQSGKGEDRVGRPKVMAESASAAHWCHCRRDRQRYRLSEGWPSRESEEASGAQARQQEVQAGAAVENDRHTDSFPGRFRAQYPSSKRQSRRRFPPEQIFSPPGPLAFGRGRPATAALAPR